MDSSAVLLLRNMFIKITETTCHANKFYCIWHKILSRQWETNCTTALFNHISWSLHIHKTSKCVTSNDQNSKFHPLLFKRLRPVEKIIAVICPVASSWWQRKKIIFLRLNKIGLLAGLCHSSRTSLSLPRFGAVIHSFSQGHRAGGSWTQIKAVTGADCIPNISQGHISFSNTHLPVCVRAPKLGSQKVEKGFSLRRENM